MAAVTVTACRLAYWEPRLNLDELVERLRHARPWMGRRASPQTYAAVAGRLVRMLPPWRMGRCLKRSLILLSLWSGCGLEPRLVLGLRRDETGSRQGHAWLEVGDPELDRLAGSPAGAVAAMDFDGDPRAVRHG